MVSSHGEIWGLERCSNTELGKIVRVAEQPGIFPVTVTEFAY